MKKEILKEQVEALEESIKSKYEVIFAANNVIKEQEVALRTKKKELAEMEAEKSAAEEWLKKRFIAFGVNSGKGVDLSAEIKRAHEAGQAHAAEREIKRCSDIFRDYLAEANRKGVYVAEIPDIFINNQPQEEKQEIIGIVRRVEWCNLDNMQRVAFELPSDLDFRDGQKYKLILIKD
jgi:hypothetical protein